VKPSGADVLLDLVAEEGVVRDGVQRAFGEGQPDVVGREKSGVLLVAAFSGWDTI
jgi:hypothetical protein